MIVFPDGRAAAAEDDFLGAWAVPAVPAALEAATVGRGSLRRSWRNFDFGAAGAGAGAGASAGAGAGAGAGTVAVSPGSDAADALLRRLCAAGLVLAAERPVRAEELEPLEPLRREGDGPASDGEGGGGGARGRLWREPDWDAGRTPEEAERAADAFAAAAREVALGRRVSRGSVREALLDDPAPAPAPGGWVLQPEGGAARARAWHRDNPGAEVPHPPSPKD
jgi:hypothetical protein